MKNLPLVKCSYCGVFSFAPEGATCKHCEEGKYQRVSEQYWKEEVDEHYRPEDPCPYCEAPPDKIALDFQFTWEWTSPYPALWVEQYTAPFCTKCNSALEEYLDSNDYLRFELEPFGYLPKLDRERDVALLKVKTGEIIEITQRNVLFAFYASVSSKDFPETLADFYIDIPNVLEVQDRDGMTAVEFFENLVIIDRKEEKIKWLGGNIKEEEILSYLL